MGGQGAPWDALWRILWTSQGGPRVLPGVPSGEPYRHPLRGGLGAPQGPLLITLWTCYGGLKVLPLWEILRKSYGGPRVLHSMPSGRSYGNPLGGLRCSLGPPFGGSYGNPMGGGLTVLARAPSGESCGNPMGGSGCSLVRLLRILWKSHEGPSLLPGAPLGDLMEILGGAYSAP